MVKHYGLIGAHRVGKTTLAKLFSQRTGIPYHDVDVRGMIAGLGYDPKTQYDIGTRLKIQMHLLDSFETMMEGLPTSVLDRTPIDFLMYMTADILRDFPPALERQFDIYSRSCLEVYNNHFSAGCLIQPGIPLVEAATSAPASAAYIKHLNFVVKGICANPISAFFSTVFIMPEGMLDLELRFDYLQSFVFHN